MNKDCQQENVATRTNLWDEAIADAEKKIKRLKDAVGSFKAHRDAGIEWPTETQQH